MYSGKIAVPPGGGGIRDNQGRSKGGGQVGPAHPRILLAHPRIKVKHIKNKIHLQYLSIICLWFKIWPTPAKNHCYALGDNNNSNDNIWKLRYWISS
jgi:hypothetical protein